MPATMSVAATTWHLVGADGAKLANRYVVLSELGAGGMGRVLAAFDLKLQRKVALKVLRTDLDTSVLTSESGSIATHNDNEANRRLIREARALARLDHPNIVAIYDLTFCDGNLCLAMELIEGVTLQRWLRVDDRAVDQRLAMVMQAGEGLAAAHQAGLVHRDFKPENVLIDRMGCAKVLDFGLVQAAGERVAKASGAVRTRGVDEGAAIDLTQAGTRMGTPLYMAPEQHAGEPTDQRTDIFSFCVVLFIALYGCHPFTGQNSSVEELAAATAAGRIVHLSRRQRLSGMAGLEPILRRGMAADPAHRFVSMRELLDAIANNQLARRYRWRMAVASVGTLLAAAAWSLMPAVASSNICAVPEAQIDGHWNSDRAAVLERHIQSLGVPDGSIVWQHLAARLSDYREQWIDQFRHTCEEPATLASQRTGASVDDQRRCLGEALSHYSGLLSGLAQADAKVLTSAVQAVDRLIAPSRCADPDFTRTSEDLPVEAVARDRSLELRREFAKVEGLSSLGLLDQAHHDSQLIWHSASEFADFGLMAKVDALRGSLACFQADVKRADFHFTRGILYGTAGKNRLEAALSAVNLIFVRGYMLNDHVRGQEVVDFAPFLLHGANAPMGLRADYYHLFATMQASMGRTSDGMENFARGLALARTGLGERHPKLIGKLSDYAASLIDAGDVEGGVHALKEAIFIAHVNYGDYHSTLPIAYHNLGEAQSLLAKYQAALLSQREAIAICHRLLGLDHLACAAFEVLGGQSMALAGHYNEALAHLQRAAKNQASGQRRGRPWEPWAEVGLGQVAILQGDFDLALSHARRYVEKVQYEAVLAPQERLRSLMLLADVQLTLGNVKAAALAMSELRQINPAQQGDGVPFTQISLELLEAELLRQQGEPQRALHNLRSHLNQLARQVPATSPGLSSLRLAIARLARQCGELEQASQEARLAVQSYAQEMGEDNHVLVPYWLEIGEIELVRGDALAAQQAFSLGLALFSAKEVPPHMQAPLRWGLARALRMLNQPAAADFQAKLALQDFSKWQPSTLNHAAKVKDWLDTQAKVRDDALHHEVAKK